jgi:hypothetical protein
MLELQAGVLADGLRFVSALNQMFLSFSQSVPHNSSMAMFEDSFDAWISKLEPLVNECDKFGMRLSRNSGRRLLAMARDLKKVGPRAPDDPKQVLINPQKVMEFRHLFGEFSGRLVEELGMPVFLSLSPGMVDYYQPTEPLFGQEVADKFQSLQYEIGEAGKCFALGRSTASAFHSIRCLEAGIAALSRCLGIPDPTRGSERNWANLLRAIKTQLDTRWPPGAARFSGDGEFFESAYATLAALQNPYRNATMHLDAKYTEEEALDVMLAVRRFIKKIADRMDETGDPKA